MDPHDHYVRRILTEVEAGNAVSQRSLAQRAGIALGLTNLLVKRLVRKGWIRIIQVRPNRVKYLITPAGLAEKARMSSAYFARSLQFYSEARDRIQARFSELEAGWPGPPDQRRIAFFGDGEVAEIGYVCLQLTAFQLVGIVSPEPRPHFFGTTVHPVSELTPGHIGCIPFDVLVVASWKAPSKVEDHLRERHVPLADVFWL